MRLLLKNLLFTILVPGTVAFYVPLWIVSGAAAGHASTPVRYLGVPLLAAGAVIYCCCLWDFATFGRATPAPTDAPRRLVVRGLYHYVRNPMYVAVLSVILGWTVYFVSWKLCCYALAVGALFHLFTVFYEEPTLRRTFGTQYDDYAATVNRWLPRPRGARCGATCRRNS